MATAQLQTVVRHLHRLVGFDSVGNQSDAELLRRYLAQKEEAAFEALVWRHGGMVYNLCRRMLRHEQDAEDVFQATFMALVREGTRISRRESTGSWLFKVAYRIACKVRVRAGRQATVASADHDWPSPSNDDEAAWRDVRPVLDEEVDLLPAKYRRLVVLCYFEGKTNEQAALELGCPKGTVATRLAWARERLRSRLTRRGVTLSAAALGVLLTETVTFAAMPFSLVVSTTKITGNLSVGGIAAATAVLAEEVVHGLKLAKLKTAATVLLGLGLLIGGAGWVTHQVFGAKLPASDESNTAIQHAEDKDAKARENNDEVRGQVVDPEGRPAANVTVWLVGGTYVEPAKAVADRKTDARGQFSVPVDFDNKNVRLPSFIARDAQGRLGWTRSFRKQEIGQKPLLIQLREVGDITGRLLNESGNPIAGAEIRPYALSEGSFRDERADAIELIDDLSKQHSVRTETTGSFVLHSLPITGHLGAQVITKNFGNCRIVWDCDKPVTLRLERPGSIRGKITGLTDAKGLSQARLSLQMDGGAKPAPNAEFQVFHYEEQQVGENRSFEFKFVPPGRYKITLYSEQPAAFFADPTDILVVKAGAAIQNVDIRAQPTITVSGRVVDAVSGEGIKGLEFWIHHFVESANQLHYAARVTTDADGRYSANVKPGKITVGFHRTPDDYLEPPPHEEFPRVDAKSDIEYPTVKLTRCARVEGTVVDEAGRAVAGAKVHAVVGARPVFYQGGKVPVATSDHEGKFLLTDLNPADKVPVGARTSDAATEASILVHPLEEKEPLRLVVTRENAFHLRGMVVNETGQPVRGVAAAVIWDRDYVPSGSPFPSGTGKLLETCATDAKGLFRSKAVWPGDNYHIEITAEGFAKVVTPKVTGVRGSVQDYGKITLARVGLTVRGKVVDYADRPIAGVRVFNSGDGPKPVRTVTDGRGQFKLDELNAGPVYIFAEKAGFRFTGVRVQSGSDVTIRLLPPVDTPSPAKTKPAEISFQQEQDLARRMLERLWELPDAQRRDTESGLLMGMARIDPEQALRWTAEVKGRYVWHTRGVIARKVAETSADKALEALAPLGDPGYHLRALAERYAKSDRAKALRFAEAAVAAARKGGDTTYSVAMTGDLLVRLGKKEEGRRLIDEAVKEAEKLGSEDRDAFARGAAAKAIAPFDLEKAKALLKPMSKGQDIIRYSAWVAVAVGDPAFMPTSHVFKRIAMDKAYTNPHEAVKLAEKIEDVKERVETFAGIAGVIAAKDKKLAWSLIDRALDLCINEPDGFRSWSNYGRAGPFAAWVAVKAADAGYPDMESVVHRVLAARPSSQYETPAWIVESQVALAMVLGLVDRPTAKDLLKSIEPRSHLLGTGLGSVGRPQYFKAWALVDPEFSTTLFEKELAGLDTRSDRGRAIVEMVELLTVPPAERPEFLLRHFGVIWFPGEE